MAVLLRIFLVGFLVYFILRIIGTFGAKTGQRRTGDDRDKNSGSKGFPKDMGEYVDYEEVKDDE